MLADRAPLAELPDQLTGKNATSLRDTTIGFCRGKSRQRTVSCSPLISVMMASPTDPVDHSYIERRMIQPGWSTWSTVAPGLGS